MNIVKDFRNDLLKRREVEVIMDSNSNPGFKGAKKFVLDSFEAGEERIVVRAVRSEFGNKEFLVDVFIYDSKKDMDWVEPRSKKVEGEKTSLQEKSKSQEISQKKDSSPSANPENCASTIAGVHQGVHEHLSG